MTAPELSQLMQDEREFGMCVLYDVVCVLASVGPLGR